MRVFLFSCFPGHCHFEELPYAQIASENNVSVSAVRLCVESTTRRFWGCVEDRQDVAFLWRGVGMLIIQGKDVKMKFYENFLSKLNGTTKSLKALLKVGYSFLQHYPWFFCCAFQGLGGCFLLACRACSATWTPRGLQESRPCRALPLCLVAWLCKRSPQERPRFLAKGQRDGGGRCSAHHQGRERRWRKSKAC